MTQPTNKGTALITGASTGIGATYADRMARRGYDLLLVARDLARLNAAADKLRKETGVEVEVLQADLTVKADLLRVEERLRTDKSITMLVNNAGVASAGKLMDTDLEQVESMIQINVVALTRLASAAAANFTARGAGVVINLGSVVALNPAMFNAAYAASKAYVLSLTQSLQHEVADTGVRVQAVLPGATRTEIWERAGYDVNALPAEIVMDVNEMVDAAIAGLDQGELVTIPSLPHAADWEAFMAARQELAPNISRNRSAPRYGVRAVAAA
jgi:hypothetical protein